MKRILLGLTILGVLVTVLLVGAVTSAAGPQPPAHETLAGNVVSVANGASGAISFDTKIDGSNLLNLSDPSNPRVVTAGLYAVTVVVGSAQPMSPGGRYFVDFSLDPDGANASDVSWQSDAADAAVTEPTAPPGTLVYYIPAGGRIMLIAYNADGAHSVGFALNEAIVQRVS